ncbi:MAG: 50S ribosomal protein L10 [Candidatus Pacearchaeota archaeon]
MERKKIKKVNEKKVKLLNELKELEKKYNTILIASTKSLPDKQLQQIKKDMREKAIIKVIKKKIMFMAFEDKNLEKLKDFIEENSVIIFSNEDPFDLSIELSEKKNPVKAKVGQIAEEDIYAEAGPTDLVPGPVISELNSLKIKFVIEDGKISIKERSLIVKKNEIITEEKAGLMSKLDIKPFYVGLKPIAAYYKKENKIYNNLNFSRKDIIEKLITNKSKSLTLSIKINYICKENIKYLLAKAKSHFDILNKLIK